MINFIKTPVNKSNLASNSSLNNQVMLDEQDLKYKQSQFWYLAAKTIDNSLGNVKSLLNKYGYNPLTKEEAITNITQIIGTNKWDPFLNEFADIMEFSLYGIRKPIKLDKNIQKENETMQILTPFVEESGWIEAIAGLVGSVTTASLNFASSKKQLEATKDTAKAQMISSLAAIKAEAERTRGEVERTKAEAEKTKRFITISVIISLAIIISIALILIFKNINFFKKRTS